MGALKILRGNIGNSTFNFIIKKILIKFCNLKVKSYKTVLLVWCGRIFLSEFGYKSCCVSSQPPTGPFFHHPTRIPPHSHLLPQLLITTLSLHASLALSAHIPSSSPTACSLLFTCCTLCYLLKHSRKLPIKP